MMKKVIYLLGIVFTIGIGTVLYCCLTDLCDCFFETKTELESDTVETPIENATKNPFSISDDKSDFKVEVPDNFNFNLSQFGIADSLSVDMKDGLQKLKDYIIKDSLKTVDISGYFKSDENNTSAFPNIGMARSNAVKNHLVSLGISAKQINVNGMLNDDFIADTTGKLFGPLAFNILTAEPATSEEDALKAICEGINENPLVLNFEYGSSDMDLTEEQRQQFADISKCIDKLGVKAQLVGHTDNASSARFNQKLGLKRANFAKAYLVGNGILENNIQTSSKGESEPIETNDTEEGRAKNRRTVITITN